ncbi:MAG TPA: hypothetical protein VMU04_09685 [Candidatus Acidoferrum sp.]|nr:hypothetical protein [Candidatus Acidoferrum sp.]
MLVPVAAGRAADFTMAFGPDVAVPEFNCLDIDPAVVCEGGQLEVVYGAGGAEHLRIRRFAGPDLDHLHALPDGKRDASFTQPFGDDSYWVSAAWVEPRTHRWLATVHVEFRYHSTPAPNFHHFRRIGLASSADHGATWHYEGDILTSDNPLDPAAFPGHFYDWGCGDQKLYVDARHGWFYLWYMHSWVHKQTGLRYQSMRVARCRIADRMAPGAWTKWYRGAWSQPGLGGHDSDVFVNADNTTVTYNKWLKRYLALGTTMQGTEYVATCRDLGKQDWTPMQQLAQSPRRLLWYNFALDPARDRWTTGKTFRLYSSCCHVAGLATKYMEVTLGPGTTGTTALVPLYPPEPVNDGNPEWEQNPGP